VLETGDIAIRERRTEVRIAVSLPAKIVFTDRRNASGKPVKLDCRAVNMSASAIAVRSDLDVWIGEHAMLQLEEFGEFRGEVCRQLEGGFVLKIEQTPEESEALAIRIHGFEKIKNHDVPERRGAKRIVPGHRDSRLIWADGTIEPCTIIDLSTTGAAVSAKTVPEIGDVLALGRLVGRVARRFKGGFAIQFIDKARRNAG
jgi:hypothetical protein